MTKEFDPETDLEFIIDLKLKEVFKNESGGGVAAKVETNSSMNSTLSEVINISKGQVKTRVVFFDYQQDFFEKVMGEVSEDIDYDIVEEIEPLTKRLAGSEKKILFLYYSGYPRLCNKMIPLVRSKFPTVQIVLVAKKLTADKVQEHRNSDLAADDYLSVPFSKNDLFKIILKHN